MRIEDGVTPIVSVGHVLFSLLGYTLVYGALMVAMLYLMVKFVKVGPEDSKTASPEAPDAMPSLVGAQD
jgi:cytochrome d ubiquinol oxidase subunit I